MKKEMTLEETLVKLEEITSRLQSDEIPVDEALKLFEEGTKLVRLGKEKLDKAELKITELSEEMNENDDEE